ncbi:MAG: ABC transporter permease [Chloroflexi bacterium]|nr:MAG: ABC transporter permease [Chloroflexota bacterium]
MNPKAQRLLRVPLTIGAAWAILATTVPSLMSRYTPYVTRPGLSCGRNAFGVPQGADVPAGGCTSVADIYGLPFMNLLIDSTLRSLALLIGAAVLALILGTLLGVAAALGRRRAFASGGIIGITTLIAAVPAFFVAYFLQIIVILLGESSGRGRLLPVYGFGYDEHLFLPLLAVSLAAIAYTAQLTATRMQDVLDSDFITTATAKGLRTRWILGIHVLPHVRPVLLEALGSGLRVSVASLPIVEYLFQWRGIGQLALEAVGVHDALGLVFSAVVLAALFACLSAIADLSRPGALYRAT